MIDVIMPKMGESITEGTILEWKKKIGDSVDKDETILEISTDKVDSEVPSPAAGILIEIIANVNDVVPVGNVIARIGDADEKSIIENLDKKAPEPFIEESGIEAEDSSILDEVDLHIEENNKDKKNERSSRFYSPLVKSIAKKENVSFEELDAMAGSGKNGRVNKKDLLNYLENRSLSVSSENNLDSVISYLDNICK